MDSGPTQNQPYGNYQFLPGQVFHYGQAIFEGMKAYRGTRTGVA